MRLTTIEVKAWTTCPICRESAHAEPLNSNLPWVREILQYVKPGDLKWAFWGHRHASHRHDVGLSCALQALESQPLSGCCLCREAMEPPVQLVVYGRKFWLKSAFEGQRGIERYRALLAEGASDLPDIFAPLEDLMKRRDFKMVRDRLMESWHALKVSRLKCFVWHLQRALGFEELIPLFAQMTEAQFRALRVKMTRHEFFQLITVSRYG